MSHIAGSCKIVRFTPKKDIAENLQEFAEDFFTVVTVDYGDDGLQQLCGYLPQNVSAEQLQKAADAWQIKLPAYQISILSSKDWLADNVIEFAPVETPNFYIYGVHEKNIQIPAHKYGIKIYAATAFGSEHQTTRACLQAISDINAANTDINKILDVGTGSGILALAAAKIWQNSQIVAVDIDDEAVAVATQNAADNQLTQQITCAYSDGYQSPLVSKNAPYDVIFANILARPLIAMAADMSKSLRSGGYAVISGFIADQVDWVLEAHFAQGLRLEKLYEFDDWRAALLRKE